MSDNLDERRFFPDDPPADKRLLSSQINKQTCVKWRRSAEV